MPNGCLMSGLFFRGIYNGKKKLPKGALNPKKPLLLQHD
mgnify:CR=1 FL=1